MNSVPQLAYVGAVATFWTLGCDADDPQRIAAFWALALGYAKEPGFDEPDNASIVDPDGQGRAIAFLRVPEGKPDGPRTGRRIHLDVMAGWCEPGSLGRDARRDLFSCVWAPVERQRA
jgi:hypothetical protein